LTLYLKNCDKNESKIFTNIFLLNIFCATASSAALPFITDDAFIQAPNQFSLETFAERWSLPKKAMAQKNNSTSYH